MAWGIKSGRHIAGLVLLVMLLLGSIFPPPGPAWAASPPPAVQNMVFILDASGSMWGRIDKRPKIAIAKEVMTQLINELPDGAPVGLTAYGHRRKGDCNDVEALFPLGPLNKAAILKTIAGLNPKGKTPMIRSLRLTAERLRQEEDETTIILVSDGKETCDPDPCKMVEELRKTGIKFVLHIIGFDVGKEEREELECMARAGGGEYFTAANADELLKAAKEVVETATFQGGYLKVTTLRAGQPVSARAEAYRRSDNQQVGGKSTWYQDKPGKFALEPGVYYLKIIDDAVKPPQRLTVEGIEIIAGQTVDKTVSLDPAGVLVVKALKDGKPVAVWAHVFREGDDKRVADKNTWYSNKPAEFHLIPDRYRLEVVDDSVKPPQKLTFRNIEITAGRTVDKTVSLDQEGLLRVTTTKNGKPVNARADVYRQKDNKRVDGKSTWYSKKPAVFKLMAGLYSLKIIDDSVKPPQIRVIKDLEIKPGETVDQKTALDSSGTLVVTTVKNDQPFNARADVYRQKDKKRISGKSTWYSKKPARFKLMPEVYILKIIDDSVRPVEVQEIRDVEVKAGETIERKVTFGGSGELVVTTVKNGQPFNARASVYRVSDNKRITDKSTWYSKKPARFQLTPGVYYLKIIDSSLRPVQTKKIDGIEIKPGETVEQEIPFTAAGVLIVGATRKGKPINARADVYRQGDNKRVRDKGTWYRKKPAEFHLLPDVYNLKIYDSKTKQTREIKGIELKSGGRVEKTVAF